MEVPSIPLVSRAALALLLVRRGLGECSALQEEHL